MKVDLLEMEETRRRIMSKIDSRDWWVIVVCTKGAADLLCEIEARHYPGEKADDLHIAMLPPGMLHRQAPLCAIAMAKKEHMGARELARVFQGCGIDITAREFVQQDILFPMPVELGNWLVGLLYRWLHRPEMN